MEKQTQEFVWKIGGAAGEGIMVSGLLFSRACLAGGLFVYDYSEYPSLIRGGHNTYVARVSNHEVTSSSHEVDILVALNKDTVEKNASEIRKGGACIVDTEDEQVDLKIIRKDVVVVPIAMTKIASDIAGNPLMRNTVGLGATLSLLSYPLSIIEAVVKKVFHGKSEEIIRENIECVKAGYEAVSAQQKKRLGMRVQPIRESHHLFITGNEALAIGAIAAGCKFFAGYPMTPASSIMMYLADHAQEYGMVVKHAEDEIAAITMAIGAGHMGVRSMTATSGGGFDLMVEAYGLAAATETPLVIVEAQRPGPSTGMPTWTSQGDLKFVLSASQGDFPRFVLAPGDVPECFSLMAEAHNVAEKYQTPVILLTDKLLAESHQTVPPFDSSTIVIDRGSIVTQKQLQKINNFKRYALDVHGGISPRSFPGMKGGIYVANSDEHDEFGYSTEDAGQAKAMMDKRMAKQDAFLQVMPKPKCIGDDNAKVTLLCWGSVKGAVVDAMRSLQSQGIPANYCCITWLSPFPAQEVKRILQNAKHVILVENNQTGQLGSLIREQTGISITDQFLKYDGRPFFASDIIDYVRKHI